MAKGHQVRSLPRLPEESSAELNELDGEVDLIEVTLKGDLADRELDLPEFRGCRFDRVLFTASVFRRPRFVDCVFTDCDLSGLVVEGCSMTRVELRSCRASGLQCPNGRFVDVGVFDSKMVGANFRMSRWDRAEMFDCDLSESDFQAAKMPDSRLLRCNLTGADLSNCDMRGSSLIGSDLEGIRGAGSLHEVTIGSDQIIQVAMAVFATMKINIDDDA